MLPDLLAWVADNLGFKFSVNALARRAAMSPRNFARIFREEIGETPARHIETLRVEAARRQLETTVSSLDEVRLWKCRDPSPHIFPQDR
jgi:transcriptional regulator GlxA family with amidase domain